MESNLTYMDTYVLQKDMRIRLPKAVITNLDAEKGVTEFDIFFDPGSKSLVLKVHNNVQAK